MSINNFLDTDLTIPIIIAFIIIAVVMIVAIPAGSAMGKKINNDIYGDDEYGTVREEKNATIIAKRTIPHPLNRTTMINMIGFEFENGSRVELAIKDSTTYGIMVEGDRGTLKYQGKKFVDFKRGSNNEA